MYNVYYTTLSYYTLSIYSVNYVHTKTGFGFFYLVENPIVFDILFVLVNFFIFKNI